MSSITLITRSLMLDKEAMNKFSQSQAKNKWSTLIIILLGIAYGGMTIWQNLEYVQSFESELLKNVLVPLIFIGIGLITVWLTRLAFSLLLWAAARGFGGAGVLKTISRATSIALIPALLAMPAFIATTGGNELTILHIMMAIFSLIWVYFICVKALEATQNFQTWKAYSAVLVIFIFFLSIYYIVLPPM